MPTDRTAVRPPPAGTGGVETALDAELAGLDALEAAAPGRTAGWGRRIWQATWPKLGALAIIVLVWQIAVWLGWKPLILQTPWTVAKELRAQLADPTFWRSVGVTFEQALIGFSLAVFIGAVVGTAVARIPVVRAAIASLITGMQTMPSVLWYPLAFMVFGLTQKAIILMIVLGSAPAVANGFISGIDTVPPVLLRVGRVLGAKGPKLQRHVVWPAALPAVLGGLKQGWAFGWHALMAGEFLIPVANQVGLGLRTENYLNLDAYSSVVAMMIVIIVIGIVVDMCFGRAERAVRRRYGLIDVAQR